MTSFVKSATRSSEFPNSDLKQIVFVGKSNVGKSSFINELTKQKISKVGKTPGKTKLINFFNVNDKFMLVDVPGYGFANISKDQQIDFGEMMEDYFNNNEHLKMMIQLVDIRRDPSKDDLDMYEFAKEYGIKTLVIANKIDKVSKNQMYQSMDKYAKAFGLTRGDIIPFSCLNHSDVKVILEAIDNLD